MDKNIKFLRDMLRLSVKWFPKTEEEQARKVAILDQLTDMTDDEITMARILYAECEDFNTYTISGILDCVRRLYESGYILVPRKDLNK